MIEATLGKLAAGEDLSSEETCAAVEAVMQGRCSEGEIALLLTGLRLKGETVQEVAGAAQAMRRQMTPIRTSRTGLVDTCGTGGDGSKTFNISTAAALLTAAAGVPVAKHGNRRATSLTGSADVLAELGVNINADVATVEACLDELGVCFCFAPLLHASMKHVADVRRQLDFPTIFNMLGPLTNPAGAPYQVIGVARDELRPLLAQSLMILGTEHALIVHGDCGLDEVSLSGPTQVTEARGKTCLEFEWTSETFQLPAANVKSLIVKGPAESAAMITKILSGQRGAARDITVLNAAAALWTAGARDKPAACARLAEEALDSGAARDLLAHLVERSRS